MAESECSTFWPFFSPETGNKFLFHCLKCIFECINGFNTQKSSWGIQIIQMQLLKSGIPTISDWILGKIDWKI